MHAEPPADDSDARHELMAQCVEAWHRGGSHAVDALLAQHPEQAPMLRERLAKLERAGLLAPADAEEDPAAIPERLGEFQLLRRLGGGGMGVVYVAEQLSLGRTVALKLVRPEQRFFPGARARFRREVEAIARLGDAGIVPIHSVGQDQGIDFFAMEFVRGASLADVIAALHEQPPAALQGRDLATVAAARGDVELPIHLPELFAGTWVQTCCRTLARMARAAHHAHERGVVHRDLKPGNAMVTPDGRVLLLDFGLAAAAGTSRITRSGAMLGTLHYMAPEQLLDGDIDARTDVYALGVTLYELLALRSPYEAASSEGLRQRILHGEHAALTSHNADVPRDVQTIVAVAMDRDPTRRYPSAEALAADLERFLQHRPITARPVGAWLRAVRWAQRHPAWATAAGLAVLAAAMTPTLIRLSRGDVEARLDSAQESARSNLVSALNAIENILVGARSAAMVATPGLDPERQRQMREATQLLERVWRGNPSDPVVLQLVARASVRIADLQRQLGELQAALRELDQGDAALQALRAAGSADAVAVEHAALLLARGSVLADLGRLPEAHACWRTLVDTYEQRPAGSRELHVSLATGHNNLGRDAQARGDLATAELHLRRSLAIEAANPSADASIAHAIDVEHTHINLATVLLAKGDTAAARGEYESVHQRLNTLLEQHPRDPELRRECARTEIALAHLAASQQDYPASLPRRERAVETMRTLVHDFPDRVPYRRELGLMLIDLGAEREQAKQDGALAAADEAITNHEALHAKVLDNPEYACELAALLQQRSAMRHRAGQLDEAMRDIVQAMGLMRGLLERHPQDGHFPVVAAGLHQEIGLHHWKAQRWSEARDAWRQAMELHERALAAGNQTSKEPRRLPKLLMVFAQAEYRCENPTGVVAALRRLQQLQPLPAAHLADVGKQLHVDDRADFQALLEPASTTK